MSNFIFAVVLGNMLNKGHLSHPEIGLQIIHKYN